MNISKNTMVGVSLGTLITIAPIIWVGIGTAQGYINQITMNAQAIEAVVKSLELSRIDRQIEGFRKERRDLKRSLRMEPDNDLLLDQIEELDDSIESSLIVRECVVDPAKEICE